MDKHFDKLTTEQTTRRDLLRKAVFGAAAGAAALAIPSLADAKGDDPSPVQVLQILDLLSAFHLAKNNQDIDLMMSLWADGSTLDFPPFGTFVGKPAIKDFLNTHGSFVHKRYSLTPNYKDTVDVQGNEASFYFECHDVAADSMDNFTPPLVVVSSLFLAGTVRKIKGNWLFWDTHAGSALPLSTDHDYFP